MLFIWQPGIIFIVEFQPITCGHAVKLDPCNLFFTFLLLAWSKRLSFWPSHAFRCSEKEGTKWVVEFLMVLMGWEHCGDEMKRKKFVRCS